MKKENFRIGNYLQDAKGRLCNVDALGTDWNEDGVEATAIDGPLTTKPVEPIPLTAEWLEKLGALKDEYGDVFIEVDSDSDMRLYLSLEGHIQLVQSHHCPMFDYEHIKCVHQLQNLFSVLTGKELTIEGDKL